MDDNLPIDSTSEPQRESCLIELKSIISLIDRISQNKREHYALKVNRLGDERLEMTSDGRKLFLALIEDIPEAYRLFPRHTFNPIIETVREASELLKVYGVYFCMMTAHQSFVLLKDCLNYIRSNLNSDEHKKCLNRFRKSRNKRKKSIKDTIDLIFKNFSRALVLRVDFSYRSCPGTKGFTEPELTKVKNDWTKMRTDLRSGRLDLDYITSIAKLECGLLKGYHFHVLIFLNGSCHSHDIGLAKMIGNHWRDHITNGEGRYYNCNLKKFDYPQRGIGQINHGDTTEIFVLKEVIGAYLSKSDDIIQLPSKYGRVLFQGQVKEKSTRGRPRGLQNKRKASPITDNNII
jgi:hypothetical protein